MRKYQLPMNQWKEIKGWYGFDASCRRRWHDNYFLQAAQETFENLEQHGCMVINSNIVLFSGLAVAIVIFKYQRTILWTKVKSLQFYFSSSSREQVSSASSSRNHCTYSHASPLVLTWTKTLRGFLPIFATARSRWLAICEAQKLFRNDDIVDDSNRNGTTTHIV